MPRLDHSLSALAADPGAFGLATMWPKPRTDGLWTHPVEVDRVVDRGDNVLLDYSYPVRHRCLIRADVIWHQRSDALAVVVDRISRRTCVAHLIVAPDEDALMEEFLRSRGTGTWMHVCQAWRTDWKVPNELVAAMPEIVDATDPDILDLLPAQRGGARPWSVTGEDPSTRLPLTAEQRAFFRAQRVAFRKMAAGIPPHPDNETALPDEDTVRREGGVSTHIPVDPTEPPPAKGTGFSYRGKKGDK